MGWTFHNIDELPEPGDIVWCKWPHRELPGQPGPYIRPVLVRQSFVRKSESIGQFGSLIVSYGTGVFRESHRGRDLIIEDRTRLADLGLHKPTRFDLSQQNRKELLWCEEYFVAPDYLYQRNILIGSLGEAERTEMQRCLTNQASK